MMYDLSMYERAIRAYLRDKLKLRDISVHIDPFTRAIMHDNVVVYKYRAAMKSPDLDLVAQVEEYLDLRELYASDVVWC